MFLRLASCRESFWNSRGVAPQSTSPMSPSIAPRMARFSSTPPCTSCAAWPTPDRLRDVKKVLFGRFQWFRQGHPPDLVRIGCRFVIRCLLGPYWLTWNEMARKLFFTELQCCFTFCYFFHFCCNVGWSSSEASGSAKVKRVVCLSVCLSVNTITLERVEIQPCASKPDSLP